MVLFLSLFPLIISHRLSKFTSIFNTCDRTNFTEESSDEKPKFVPQRYPRAWEIELTDEQRENLRRSIEEDEKKYKEIGKKLAEDRDYSRLFNQGKKK